MLKLDWETQRRHNAALLRGPMISGWYWTWGNYGGPWAEPGKYWLWGLGFVTIVVYDGRLWSIQPNID